MSQVPLGIPQELLQRPAQPLTIQDAGAGTAAPVLDPVPVLGRKVDIPQSPADAIIDIVSAPCANGAFFGTMLARFSCPEFTSLCPVTGQPDFAHFVIDYMPDRHLIESKALKLYLAAFRNHAAFHESCTNDIGNKLFRVCMPHWLRVSAFWFPRGGIPIDVFWEGGRLPPHARVPPIDIPSYRAR